ncbi:MAG: hypothetical protein MJH11_17225, partial [Lentisphaeria bacterium]|nr:hypothetical protein [Lentisphaeria bacterium]
MKKLICSFFLNMSIMLHAAVSDADVLKKIVNLKIDILKSQNTNGSWNSSYKVGMTALCLLALIHSDSDIKDEAVVDAIHYLLNNSDKKTYSEALVAVVLETINAKKYKMRINQSYSFLEAAQKKNGAWGYTINSIASDNSNSQFAVMGIDAARRAGIPVNKAVLDNAKTYWKNFQNNDGSWGYSGQNRGMFSMTCAGVASVYLLGERLYSKPNACGDTVINKRILKGLENLAKNLKGKAARIQGRLYSLYALERVAIYLGLKEIGGVDWYRWGAEHIVNNDKIHTLSDKAFALLFLAKGSAPIAVAKWQWKGDWDNQKEDVKFWTQYSSESLGKKLDWLVSPITKLDAPAAKASLIFVNGRERFRMNDYEEEFLKSF